ncbi:Aspartate/ornithine carbamoyltransferase [Naematelia encephala]|uniref:ornithine carbamoyltransferase n=1 Tax=Naematelia encephala TaxID=71784 RepID=A0A1Y2B2F3_9TREE|nr:Aspartate/ornithine carbamoyltransferase [Naematelia encephala]
MSRTLSSSWASVTPIRATPRIRSTISIVQTRSVHSDTESTKSFSNRRPSHLLTLADLPPAQITFLIRRAIAMKHIIKNRVVSNPLPKSLSGGTIAMLFSKRSTRTRVATETSTALLGGHAMFLGSQDIQLGVNETLEDSARVIGSMVNGIMARVGSHDEVEALAKYSPVPVINALSALYHPTQILADIMALCEHFNPNMDLPITPSIGQKLPFRRQVENVLKRSLPEPDLGLKGKKVAWVGDVNNIINEILVTLPRLGMTVSVAAPKGYDQVDPEVWRRITEAGTQDKIILTNSPEEALNGADIIVTDTWISMGQEEEKAARLEAFKGYQLTNDLINRSGAKKDWVFLHCLPRKQEEVDDEVFYGPQSIVWNEAENRKWTIMAILS